MTKTLRILELGGNGQIDYLIPSSVAGSSNAGEVIEALRETLNSD